MSETLYKKVGRRYVPIAECDPMLYDAMPEGSHLVTVKPGVRMTHYAVMPADATVLAVINKHYDALVNAVRDASEKKPTVIPVTKKQRAMWEACKKAFGGENFALTVPNANDFVRALADAIMAEIRKEKK